MNNTVYWVGANGNVYHRVGDQVYDRGKLITDYGNGFDAELQSAEANRIDDPNPPQVSSSGGGTSESAKVLNQVAINNTNKAIDSLGTELDVGYGNIDDNFNSLLGKYDKEAARNTAEYEEQGVTNNQNLLRNKQNALLAAAQGRKGLRGTLSALGALSGDGGVLADRAVTTAANQDIGGATDTYATNAQGLDKAFDRFKDEDEDRRAEARTAKENNRTALEGSVASKRQSFYQKMAELFADVDDTGNATKWLNKAGDLNPVIANKSRVASTPFSAKSAAFTPGDLESYLAGAGDLTVSTRSGGNGGSGGPTSVLAGRDARDKKREREEALV